MYRQLGHGVLTNVVRMLVLRVYASVPVLHRPQVMLLNFLVTVKAAPHECVIRTGQP